MSSRSRNIVQNLVLIALSVFFAFGVVEGVLRVMPHVLPEEVQLRLHWQEMRGVDEQIKAHPYIGHLYPAHYQGTFSRGDFHFTYHTDGFGFRNPWPWPEQAEIVAVGDSLTFSYGVGDDEAWTTRLARQLQRSRVINLGLIGAAPQQYLRVYETFGSALQPKVLLFGLFSGNDLYDARHFARWVDKGSVGNYREWLASSNRRGLRKFLNQQSYLYIFLSEMWHSYRFRLSGKTLTLPNGSALQLAPSILARAAATAHPQHRDFQLVLEAIERAQAVASQNATHFLVLLFPSKEEVYLPTLGETSLDVVGPFRQALAARQVPYLDLTPFFRQQAEAGKKLYFEVDGHPNAAGYALVAEVVLTHLRAHAEEYGLTDWP